MDGLGGYDWAAWLAAAVLLGTAEVTTLDLTFAMLATGALAGAVTGAFVDSLVVEAVVAAVVAVAALAVVRPVALRHLRTPAGLRTGVAALVGQHATVLEPVSDADGRVRLRGEVWSARSYLPGHVIAVGETVEVMSIDGATAVVWESVPG